MADRVQPLRWHRFWLFIGWSLVLTVIYLSLTGTPPAIPVITLSDKALHLLGYAALMGWFGMVIRPLRQQIVLVVGFIAMGVGLEFAQEWGGVRYFEFYDMVANSGGVLLGWLWSRLPTGQLLFILEARLGKH